MTYPEILQTISTVTGALTGLGGLTCAVLALVLGHQAHAKLSDIHAAVTGQQRKDT